MIAKLCQNLQLEIKYIKFLFHDSQFGNIDCRFCHQTHIVK